VSKRYQINGTLGTVRANQRAAPILIIHAEISTINLIGCAV